MIRHCIEKEGETVLGNDASLGRIIFDLFYGEPVGDHSGVHAARHQFSNLLYWEGLSKGVRHWVRESVICQRWKNDQSASPELLQPFPIPDRAWEAISMNFVESLPTSKGKTIILVVVD